MGPGNSSQLTRREPIRSWMCGSPRSTQRNTYQGQSSFPFLPYADKSTEMHTKEVLFKIAEEEKAHLSSLSQLMGQRV